MKFSTDTFLKTAQTYISQCKITSLWTYSLKTITDYTRYSRLCVSQKYEWSPLYIWCPVRLLCWLYTLSCTSLEYSLKLCLSILDCAYVKIQFWKILFAFHWHYSIGHSFAEVWSLLLLNIWTELRTECIDVAASWYLWLMLVWVMFSIW